MNRLLALAPLMILMQLLYVVTTWGMSYPITAILNNHVLGQFTDYDVAKNVVWAGLLLLSMVLSYCTVSNSTRLSMLTGDNKLGEVIFTSTLTEVLLIPTAWLLYWIMSWFF